MAEYNYKGMSLWEYCKNHNIAFAKVRYRIQKYLKDDKYSNYPIEEIISISMENLDISLSTKYNYKGMPLVKYCKENGIDYHLVISRIKRLEVLNKYTLKEILEIAINKPVNTYTYKGELLSEYCKKNNLNYKAIIYHFKKIKASDKYKDKSDDEIIEMLKDREYLPTPTKYFYKGIGLKKYCNDNNLNYDTIFSRYESISKNSSYSEFSRQEIIDFALETNYKIEDCMAFKLRLNRDEAIRVLKKITQADLNFLSLRYRKNYTYSQLSKLYKVDEEMIKNKEERILFKLNESKQILKNGRK